MASGSQAPNFEIWRGGFTDHTGAATAAAEPEPLVEHAVFSGDGSVCLICYSNNYMQLRSSKDGSPIGPVTSFYLDGVLPRPGRFTSTDVAARRAVGINLNGDGTVVCITNRGGHYVLRTPLILGQTFPEDGYHILMTLPTLESRLSADPFDNAIISPSGSLIFQVSGANGVINLFRFWRREEMTATTRGPPRTLSRHCLHKSITISGTDEMVAACTASGAVYLFPNNSNSKDLEYYLENPSTRACKQNLLGEQKLAFSPDGKELAWSWHSKLCVWSLASLQPVGYCSLADIMGDPVIQFRYSRNGGHTYLSSATKFLIIDMSSLKVIKTIDPSNQGPHITDVYFGIHSILRLFSVRGTVSCESLPFTVFQSVSLDSDMSHTSDSARELTGQLVIPDRPTAGGGFGEIYRASFKNQDQYILPIPEVAVKAMRVGTFSTQQTTSVKRTLEREIALWQMLKDGNILPLLGITYDLGEFPSMVSEWMPNGTVLEFLDSHPDFNRLEIISGAAHGLKFLHSYKPLVIHGDMKAANILVDSQGNSRITDFGISKVLDPATFWKITTKTNAAGSVPWMSPELLSGDEPQVTVFSDVYAFAMTSWEIITGKTPFSAKYLHAGQVITAVCLRKERPHRPDSEVVSDALWRLLVQCWSTQAESRPTIYEAYSTIKSLAVTYRPLRILSLDHSYSRIGALFVYLRQIFVRHMPIGAQFHQYFDLIGGSGFGGFVAILLGRMNLDIDQCMAEIEALYIVFWNLTKAQTQPVDLFAPEIMSDAKVASHIKNMLIRHDCDPEDNYANFDHNSTRVIVYSTSNRLVPPPVRAYSVRWEQAFSPSLHSALMDCLKSSSRKPLSNPGLLVLGEAESLFGTEREIGCFLSCGHALNASSRNPLVTSTSQSIFQWRRKAVQDVHEKLKSKLGSRYFRLDFGDYVEQEVERQAWEKVLGPASWKNFATIKMLATKYMGQQKQVEMAAAIARALQWQTEN